MESDFWHFKLNLCKYLLPASNSPDGIKKSVSNSWGECSQDVPGEICGSDEPGRLVWPLNYITIFVHHITELDLQRITIYLLKSCS